MKGATFRRLRNSSDPIWRPLIDLYTHVFEEGQRETERAILQNLVTSQNQKEGGHIVIAALGEDGSCIGGNIFSYLPAIDCGYISYIFVRPGWRNVGVGRALLEAMRRCLVSEAARLGHGWVRGLFAEIQRSDHPDEFIRQRFRFWKRAGVLPLDLDWRYPPLHEGEPPVPMYLAFGSYGRRHTAWRPGDLEKVARAIFDATYSYLPSASYTFATIIDGLHQLPQDVPVPYIRPWEAAHTRRT